MGTILVSEGKSNGIEYRIYNIDNIYTIYIKVPNRTVPVKVSEPIYSAIRSFPTLKEAQDHIIKIRA